MVIIPADVPDFLYLYLIFFTALHKNLTLFFSLKTGLNKSARYLCFLLFS